ncbi:MAG: DUF3971 domain-containing protein [Hydrogenovibrio sp.]|nr:DUF3971 domain-containing protein [Hydrogenovibrio sp.]
MRDWFYRISLVLAGIFLVYLVGVRAFLIWVQYAPQSAFTFVETMTRSTIHVGKVQADQTWAGVKFDLQDFSYDDAKINLHAKHVSGDFNIFSPWIPQLKYGQDLNVKGVQATFKNARNFFSGGFPSDQVKNLDLQDWQLQKIWKSIKLENTDFTFQGDNPANIKIKVFQSYFGLKWSFAGLVEFKTPGNLSSEFQLKGDFLTNIWNLPKEGEGAISVIRPINLEQLYGFLPKAWSQKLPAGEFVGDIRVTMNDSRLKTLKAYTNVQDLAWSENDKLLPKSIGMTLNLQSSGDFIGKRYSDWVFELERIRLDNQYIKTISPVYFSLTKEKNLSFQAETFQLHEIKPLFDLLLSKLEYQGFGKKLKELELKKVKGVFDTQKATLSKLSFLLPSIKLDQEGKIPGLVIKDLLFTKQRKDISVDIGQPVQLLYSYVRSDPIHFSFKEPIHFKLDEANTAWSLTPTRFSMNDIPGELAAKSLDEGGVEAKLSLQPGDIKTVKSYLPYSIMSKKLEHWLKTALVKGDHVKGTAYLKGRLSDFPFRQHEGVFKAQAEVQNAELKFQPNWPSVKDFAAKLTFTPYDLKITSKQAKLLNVNASDVEVNVNHLNTHNIAVDIKGQAEADAQHALDFLDQTPLTRKLGVDTFLRNQVAAKGAVKVDLKKIWVPVYGYQNRSEAVSGTVSLQDVSTSLFGKLPIEHAKGQVLFTENSVYTRSPVEATYLNGMAKIKVGTQDKTVLIQADGHANPDDKYLKGSFPWEAKVKVPFVKDKPVDVQLHADVKKVKSHFPAPLNEWNPYALKRQGPVSAHITVNHDVVRARGRIANVLKFATRWNTQQANPSGLNLVFNDAESALPMIQAGYRVRGRIKNLDLDGWKSLWASQTLSDKPSVGVKWRASDLKIEQAHLDKNDFHHIQVNWDMVRTQKSPYLALNLKADEMALVATKSDKDAYDVNLTFLKLAEVGQVPAELKTGDLSSCSPSTHPITFPNIRFKGKNIQLGARRLSELRFNLSDSPEKMVLSGLYMRLDQINGDLEGTYSFDKKQQFSYLQGVIKANRIEELSKLLGVHKGFKGKDGRLNINVNWPGTYECYTPLDLKGTVNFSLKDGVIEDAEPGLARILGLLSFESLARRLKLDLKDVTEKGLAYDSIDGHGQFNKGVFSLEELELKAPSASAKVFGEINLIQKELSLKADITPSIGGTIPAVVAISGAATPLAGLAAYALLKAVPLVNEDLVTYRYEVTGTFEKPDIHDKGLNLDLIKLKGQSTNKEQSILDSE